MNLQDLMSKAAQAHRAAEADKAITDLVWILSFTKEDELLSTLNLVRELYATQGFEPNCAHKEIHDKSLVALVDFLISHLSELRKMLDSYVMCINEKRGQLGN